jgi:nanoRNase/pAp phosphatase (c-di-AMP/oligoRNAs hydrolase)
MKDQTLMEQVASGLKNGPGIILLHNNADIDAVGSAIALQNAFPEFSIGAFQKTSHLSRMFLKNFPDIEINISPNLDEYQTILILDTSTPSQLGTDIDYNKKVIVIDHHLDSDQWGDALYYCDETKSSCAEIIFELLKLIGHNISNEVISVILAAIIVDTSHFKYANVDSIVAISELLKIGNVRLSEVFEMLGNNIIEDNSQRIAHLKGAQRLRFRQYRGFIIAVSQLSSNEASMCKYLLILGADVAFVGAQRENQFRISSRASGKMVKMGIHLGEFFQELSTDIGSEGGGHAGAAGLNGVGDVEMVLNFCMDKIEHKIDRFEN